MFLDEAAIAAQLDHPNIVKIFDIGSFNGSYFIAMEYVHGEDIRRIYNARTTLQRSLPLSHQIRVIADASVRARVRAQAARLHGHAMGRRASRRLAANILVTYDGA